MNSNPVSGAGYLLEGLKLLFKPGIRPFVLIPLLINIVVFSLLVWLGVDQFEQLMDRFLPDDESWLAWLCWLLWPLFAIAIILVVFYTFTVIANLIASP
ncbi:MAG: EI24 domain-containing protein, partial [Candidatus Thiodiazotropha taylori]|nr:EI24 domain-containing protein [Candidatus Thiodiazotropha taylori]MCW4255801.1 EI24 domain-containing protein [Candidatus Thiodiazotropha taylori]